MGNGEAPGLPDHHDVSRSAAATVLRTGLTLFVTTMLHRSPVQRTSDVCEARLTHAERQGRHSLEGKSVTNPDAVETPGFLLESPEEGGRFFQNWCPGLRFGRPAKRRAVCSLQWERGEGRSGRRQLGAGAVDRGAPSRNRQPYRICTKKATEETGVRRKSRHRCRSSDMGSMAMCRSGGAFHGELELRPAASRAGIAGLRNWILVISGLILPIDKESQSANCELPRYAGKR